MRVALIGATGLIGRQLLPLLERQHDLLVLGRRPSGAAREKLGPAEQWPDLLAGERVDVAISTLGSTIRAAGSWEALERIDRHSVTAFAGASREAGARQFLLVSSVGADPAARFPYLRIKGRLEADVRALGFERLDLVQPGLLLGPRAERRLAEGLGQRLAPLLNPLLVGPLVPYQAIESATVARALARLAGAGGSGHFRHRNAEIRSLAAQLDRPDPLRKTPPAS